jgi:uncharacterized protein DUF5989
MTSTTARPERRKRLGFKGRLLLDFQTLRQLFTALRRSRYWWLIPFGWVLILFAVLLLIVQGVPGAAPFLYAMF